MSTLDQPSFSAKMNEIDQIEICQLQSEVCHLSTENHELAQLKEVDQDQIIKLQTENDKLKRSNATKDAFIVALIQEKQDLEEQNAQLRLCAHDTLVTFRDACQRADFDAMDVDEPTKGGEISVSDSGFEGYGSEGAWDMF
ncbi:unnamed protein product [Colletotrichum noveboracense]|uniref:Uncharacterized protein n=1 Tax=Colletotrichum noveboracense TaxID=2664923 RepID=A0A9W4S0L5_9PEZI|nr:unnamed protein product [Colletotrichum noveboracense]